MTLMRPGIELLFDPLAQLALDEAIAGGRAWECARIRVIDAFASWGAARRQNHWSRYETAFGLIYPMTGIFIVSVFGHERCRDLPHPRGWRWERDFDRDVMLLMTTWLYWARAVWRFRWTIMRHAARWGFLQSPTEGDLWSNHRWTLRWWESRYSFLHPRWHRLGLSLNSALDAQKWG